MRKFAVFLFALLSPFSANATSCNAGYYLDNGVCTACENNHYCPGDNQMYECPPITYTDSQIKQLIENLGYTVTGNIGRTYLSTGWFNDPEVNTSISMCAMVSLYVPVLQGTLAVLGFRYSTETNNYTNLQMTFWNWAETGYYLSDKYSDELWWRVKACTNSHPSNSHYSGHGTADSSSITDVNDCPWACDDGYGQHGSSCLPLCSAGFTKLKTGTGLSFNVYANRTSTPAINIGHNNTVCYVNLESGLGNLNVNINGTIYHATD